MRRVMKLSLSFMFLSLLLGSCVQENDKPDLEGECIGDGQICLAFVGDNFTNTKAFGNSVATAVEKQVLSGKIFIFKSGVKVFEKLFSTLDIANTGTNPITFTVPGMVASTSYDYYVILNHGNVSASTPADLQAIIENDIASYNGTWLSVSDAALAPNRSGGFVMTGRTTQATPATLPNPIAVTVVMKRITAKLDVATTIDPTAIGITGTYQGLMTIDSVKVTRTQASTPLVITTPSATTGTLTLAKQVPNVLTLNASYQNRFYVFENAALAAGSRVLLNVYATYTNALVSNSIVYPVELSTDATGAIVRNGAYSINIKITGLNGANVAVTITLADWENLITQNTSVGT